MIEDLAPRNLVGFHGVGHLLTFNTAHFARLAGFGPGLTVVHPGRV